jgi:hypothetical protein
MMYLLGSVLKVKVKKNMLGTTSPLVLFKCAIYKTCGMQVPSGTPQAITIWSDSHPGKSLRSLILCATVT